MKVGSDMQYLLKGLFVISSVCLTALLTGLAITFMVSAGTLPIALAAHFEVSLWWGAWGPFLFIFASGWLWVQWG